jgi:hypothetical protein
MGHDPVNAVGNWEDSVLATKAVEAQVYNESDFTHLYVWCKEAGAAILTVHPEMGLAHRHVEVEPCVRGTKKDTRNIYTGYFMCLAPEDEDGEEVEDQNEHAIEAISITRKKGEETIAQALVRNPNKKKAPCSSVSQGSRAAHLFNEKVSKGQASPTEYLYNRPREPKSSNPNRTVKKVGHKDVSWPAFRQVVRVGPKVTNALVWMLNHQLATWDTEMPQPRSRLGGWHLPPVHPQPCIHDNNRVGEWLRSCHIARQLAQRMPRHSTQTPRFRLR